MEFYFILEIHFTTLKGKQVLVSLFLLAAFRDFMNDAAGTISNFNSVAEMGGKRFHAIQRRK